MIYDSEKRAKKRWKADKKATHSYNRGNRTMQSARYKRKYPRKVKAHNAVRSAMQKGLLKRPEICPKCGQSGFIQAHHRDYKRWLEVMWLCWKCHNLVTKKDGR